MTDIFHLKLHEITNVGSCEVMRVPGGWIYSHREYRIAEGMNGRTEEYHMVSPVFVPYTDEVRKSMLQDVVFEPYETNL